MTFFDNWKDNCVCGHSHDDHSHVEPNYCWKCAYEQNIENCPGYSLSCLQDSPEEEMSEEIIESLGEWSEPRRVETRNGPATLRLLKGSQERFWNHWRVYKSLFKGWGISVKMKYKDHYEISWWTMIAEKAEKSTESAQDPYLIENHRRIIEL